MFPVSVVSAVSYQDTIFHYVKFLPVLHFKIRLLLSISTQTALQNFALTVYLGL